jgi:hypothetical protein
MQNRSSHVIFTRHLITTSTSTTAAATLTHDCTTHARKRALKHWDTYLFVHSRIAHNDGFPPPPLPPTSPTIVLPLHRTSASTNECNGSTHTSPCSLVTPSSLRTTSLPESNFSPFCLEQRHPATPPNLLSSLGSSLRRLQIFYSPEAHSIQSASDHTDHLTLFYIGAGSGGSIQKAKGELTHIFITVDKFTKWVEAKLATSIATAKTVEFIKEIMY